TDALEATYRPAKTLRPSARHTYLILDALAACGRRKSFWDQPIVRRSSTDATPEADQAAFSTARRSAQLSTFPSKTTLLPFCTAIRIDLASISACRLRADSILLFTFEESTTGL